MSLFFYALVGFSLSNLQTGMDCAQVLHQLRTEHRMEVATAQTVEDTLVYLLVDNAHKKTAQIGCQLRPLQP